MVNITISIPKELHDKLKMHSEVEWSEVVRNALVEYVGRLGMVERHTVSSEKLAAMLKEANLDVSSVDLDKAVEFYEEARRLEWKRVS